MHKHNNFDTVIFGQIVPWKTSKGKLVQQMKGLF